MIKVIFFHNIVAPYRHALFVELAKLMELEVWFSALITRDRKWSTDIPSTYSHRVLKNHMFYVFGNRAIIFCPFLIRDMDRRKPDAIISVLTKSNALDVLRICFFGKRRSIPVILFVGDIESDYENKEVPVLITRIFEGYQKLVLRLAKGYIYYSELSKCWAEKRGARGPNICGTQVLDEDQIPRLTVDDTKKKVTCLYVGKLEKRKGFDLISALFKNLKDDYKKIVRLRVIGEGPLEHIIDEIRLQDTEVDYLGQVQREMIWEHYREADFLIVPSRHDPWGFVVNEAMAVGTPVLISKQAGAVDLVRNVGWSFDPNNISTFLAAFEKAVTECRNENLRKKVVERERQYRPKRCAEKINQLLTELVNK